MRAAAPPPPEVWRRPTGTGLLLLRGLQDLPGAAHQLLLVFGLLLQDGQLHLQLAHQALLVVDLSIQRAVLPPQREQLLLQALALLDTAGSRELREGGGGEAGEEAGSPPPLPPASSSALG